MIGDNFEIVLRNKDTGRETKWDLTELVSRRELTVSVWLFSRKAPWLATRSAAYQIGMAVLEKLKRNRKFCREVRAEMESGAA